MKGHPIIQTRAEIEAEVATYTKQILDLQRQLRHARYERQLRTRRLNRLGFKHSDETKAKISAARKAQVTKHQTPEFSERMRQLGTGRKASEEARANMTIAQRAAWQRRRGVHAQDPLEAAIFGERT